MIYVRQPLCFNTASGMDCMQFMKKRNYRRPSRPFQYRKRYGLHAILPMTLKTTSRTLFQYRKRYGLHAIRTLLCVLYGGREVSIPQAVWIACNKAVGSDVTNGGLFQYRKRYGLHAIAITSFLILLRRCFNTASGMDCMQLAIERNDLRTSPCFNTASGMDCMQYRPSQPLGQLNPEAGFLNGSLFWTDRRNLAGFFCRQNRLKTSANPVISRKLLSTGKI